MVVLRLLLHSSPSTWMVVMVFVLLFIFLLRGLQVAGELLDHSSPTNLVVPPLLHNQILQALKLQRVAALVAQADLQAVGLLAYAQLPADFKLPLAVAAPGSETLRVSPAQVPVLAAHLLQGVAHHRGRAEGLVAVQLVGDAAPSALAGISEEAVHHLQPVQVHDLEIPNIDHPVRVLGLAHKLHQVARLASVQ